MPSPLFLNIAEITISLLGIETQGIQPLTKAYQPFISEDKTTVGNNRSADVSLHASYGDLPKVDDSSSTVLYESGRLWNLYALD